MVNKLKRTTYNINYTTYFVLMIFTGISHSVRAIHRPVCHGYYPRSLCTIFGSTGFLNVLGCKLSAVVVNGVANVGDIPLVFIRP